MLTPFYVNDEVFFAAVIGGELSMASQVLSRLDDNKIKYALRDYIWDYMEKKSVSELNTVSFHSAKSPISQLQITDMKLAKLEKLCELLKRFVEIAVRYPGTKRPLIWVSIIPGKLVIIRSR